MNIFEILGVECLPLEFDESETWLQFGDQNSVCLHNVCYVWQDDEEEDITFCFDRVFYQDSEQSDIYEFLALPIVAGYELNILFLPWVILRY